MPASLLPLGSMRADLLFVGLALPALSLGYYAIAASLCNLPRFLSQSAGMVVYPLVAARGMDGVGARVLLASSIASGLLVAVLILIADPLIPLLFGQDYRPAIPIAQVLLVAAYLFGVRRVATDALLGTGNARSGLVAEGVAWVVYGGLLILLWQTLDTLGFALVLAAAAVISLVALGVASVRARRMVRADLD